MTNSRSTYQQTFIEQLLGIFRKWVFVVVFQYKIEGVYFYTNLLHFFGQSMSLYTALFVWSSTDPSSEIIINLLIGFVIFGLTNNTVYWEIGGLIESGKMSKLLILPSSIMNIFLLTSLGTSIRVTTYYGIILLPIFVFLSNMLIPAMNWSAYVYIILLLIVIFVIRFLVSCLIGFSAFWTTQVYGQANFYENLLPLLAGVLFPYSLISNDLLRTVLIVLPWSFITYHPMQIYLGNYNINQTLLVFAGGIAWCIILYFLAQFVFKLGLKKNEAVGL